MADKTGTKQVAIAIKRTTCWDAKLVQASAFKLRLDKSKGVVEIQLEQRGQKGERLTFDPVIIRTSLGTFKEYAAGLSSEADDAAMKDDIAPLSDADTYSNMIHLCQSGGRAETIFGRFRWADWVEATRQKGASLREVECSDALVVISSSGFQKKLVLELLAVLNEDTFL